MNQVLTVAMVVLSGASVRPPVVAEGAPSLRRVRVGCGVSLGLQKGWQVTGSRATAAGCTASISAPGWAAFKDEPSDEVDPSLRITVVRRTLDQEIETGSLGLGRADGRWYFAVSGQRIAAAERQTACCTVILRSEKAGLRHDAYLLGIVAGHGRIVEIEADKEFVNYADRPHGTESADDDFDSIVESIRIR